MEMIQSTEEYDVEVSTKSVGRVCEEIDDPMMPGSATKSTSDSASKWIGKKKNNPRTSLLRYSWGLSRRVGRSGAASSSRTDPDAPQRTDRERPRSLPPRDLEKERGQLESAERSWRPIPFALLHSEGRNVYFTRNPDDLIDIVDSDKVSILYRTNAPCPASKLARDRMPNQLDITSAGQYGRRWHEPSTTHVRKMGNEVVVEIKGLEPITFYKSRPDCFLPVDCFVAKQVALSMTSQSRQSCRTHVSHSRELHSVSYAWKHTSMAGKGGLKLVDLRDNEVLAYYELCHGKSFAKLHLQGSGLVVMRLVVCTALALRFRPLLHEFDPSERKLVNLSIMQQQRRLHRQSPESHGSSEDPEPTLAGSDDGQTCHRGLAM